MTTSLTARDHDQYEAGEHSNLRGIVTLLACSALLVGLAYLAMKFLTSPDGWVAEATLTTYQGGQPTIMASNGPATD